MNFPDGRAPCGERLQRPAVHVLLQERLPLHHAHHLPRRHDRPDGVSLPGKSTSEVVESQFMRAVELRYHISWINKQACQNDPPF